MPDPTFSPGHTAPLNEQALTSLRGVGPKLEQKLNRIGLYSVQDLLFHLPLRYQDRTRIQPMGSLRVGEQVVVEGTIELSEIGFGRRRMLLCHISDGTGALLLRFFHFSNAQKEALARGTRLRCFGEVRAGKKYLEMVHPEYNRLSAEAVGTVEETLTPLYPTTEGVHQLKMRDLVQQALQRLLHNPAALSECLPAEIRTQYKLLALADAIRVLHHPTADVPLSALQQGRHPAQQRLAFEELLAHYLSLRQLRIKMQSHTAQRIQQQPSRWAQFQSQLPFSLTTAQQRVIDEILRDIKQTVPMMRLVQGDVGSGKTIVAAAAALAAIDSGFQVALMAPTEILSEQHLQNFRSWLEPLGIQVVWLSGKLKAQPRRQALEHITNGQAQMIIGTHALFQDEVSFANLAMVIIDEQHRFGVHQRLALREKGSVNGDVAHQLIMTATPIPRTLAMTAYADLDVSVIDELPPGRIPVNTVVIPDNRRSEVLQRVMTACRQGSQAYWVCTLIEESESLQCQAASDTAELLQQALPDLQVGLVHGRLKSEQKEAVMSAFKAGEIDLLVATTVIEVGVDVPNANLMIIENAERLGLSQLHQLRGRVGRGGKESSCVLIYQGKLSQMARARLAAMRESHDGFVIAQRDLELRGPGEVLGTRQTGVVQMRIADILRDQQLMPSVQVAAEKLLHTYPQVVPVLVQRWLGQNVQYGKV
jgi:ATP-dependent DNA helicase RecG